MRSAGLIAALALAGCTKPAPAPEPSGSPEPAATVAETPAPEPSIAAPAPAPAPAPTPTPSATAKPSAAPKPPVKKQLQALGTEPFWSVDVLPHARLRYITPDMANGVIVPTVERKRGERLTYTGRFNRRPFTLDIVPGKCSDGMSDVVYPYVSTFVHSGRTDRGCARLR